MSHEEKNNRSSRRALLQSLAALGAGSILPVDRLLAQAIKLAPVTKKGRIDVHHHHRPAALGAGGGGRGPQWTPERSLEAMEKFNIATAIVSLTQLEDRLYDRTEKARAFARTANEYGAKMTRDYPGKFGLIASLPMPGRSCHFEAGFCEDVGSASTTRRVIGDGDDRTVLRNEGKALLKIS